MLELGCGAPVESTRILAERANLAGVDISEAQVALARRRLPQATFIHADLSALEFAPESFDAVVALYVLLHIPRAELEPLLGRVASWLRPSGLLANALVRGESEAVEAVARGMDVLQRLRARGRPNADRKPLRDGDGEAIRSRLTSISPRTPRASPGIGSGPPVLAS